MLTNIFEAGSIKSVRAVHRFVVLKTKYTYTKLSQLKKGMIKMLTLSSTATVSASRSASSVAVSGNHHNHFGFAWSNAEAHSFTFNKFNEFNGNEHEWSNGTLMTGKLARSTS